MYATPGRGGTPQNRKTIPEGPISDFTILIEETPADRWQWRCTALRDLVDSIPDGAEYLRGQAWYNSPPTLRHLAYAIGDLLKDPRSTVVKRTCESLTRLFNKCQNDARYLFKDLMPTILSVHAQTVQIIRNAVQDMVMETISEVPCKMVMPLWMERLKIDKSRTVREACAIYLGQSLKSWTEEGYLSPEIWIQVGATLMKTLRDPSPQVRKNAKDALLYMREAQPRCWETLLNDRDGPVSKDPKLQRWLQSLGKPESPDAEELSVASKFSYNSDTRYRQPPATAAAAARGSPGNIGGVPSYPGGGGGRGGSALSTSDQLGVPMSINVNAEPTSAPQPLGAVVTNQRLGLPARTTTAPPFPQAMDSPPPPPPPPPPPQLQSQRSAVSTPSTATESPLRQPPPMTAGTPPRHPTPNSMFHRSPKTYLNSADDRDEPYSHPDLESNPSFPSDLNQAFAGATSSSSEQPEQKQQQQQDDEDAEEIADKPTALTDDGPFIASMQELKKHASKRRSRNSIMMQERFRMSGSLLDDEDHEDHIQQQVFTGKSEEENEVPNNVEPAQTTPISSSSAFPGAAQSAASARIPTTSKSSVSAPEHMVIAIRLLRAHKAHVDAIMETLKIEMDTLRDFDRLLEEPGRPYEEEVLDYFESVGLCLDQRTQAGAGLQKEMDHISRGEPPQE